MARRSRVYVLVLLVLALTLSTVYSASVQDTAVPQMQIYEIDYQGPETHSLPPPELPYRGPDLGNSRKRDAGRDRNPVHG